jgi:hypothetical protein
METVELFGNRWDKNQAALDFEERFRRASPAKQIEVLRTVLDDDHNRFGNEIARAAGALVLRSRNPSPETLDAAIKSHRYLLQDHDWLSHFPDMTQAILDIKNELGQLVKKHTNSSKLVYASALDILACELHVFPTHASYIVETTDDLNDAQVEVGVFDGFAIEALHGLLDSDEKLHDSLEAVEEAIAHEDHRKRLDLERISVIYLPLVQSAAERLYEISGSKQHRWNEIFTQPSCMQISRFLAAEWRRNN